MKKLTLSALIASTFIITACDQAQETTEGAMDKAAEMTQSAAEHAEGAAHSAAEHAENAAEAGKEMANDAMEAGKDMAEGAMEAGKEMMDKAADAVGAFTGSGFHTGTMGHPVGTQADIDALTAEYHEKMKANQ